MKLLKKTCMMLSASALLLMGGCQSKSDEGLVKKYDKQKEVTMTMFSMGPLNSSVWSDAILAKDGTKLQIIERSADYYSKDGKSEDYRTYLLNQLKNNSDIDLYVVLDEDIAKLDNEGLFYNLKDLNRLHNLTPEALESATYNNKVIAVPLVYAAYGMYWNVDMLEQYGLKVPKNQKELLTVFETLKKNGITPYVGNMGYGLTVPTMVLGFSDIYAAANKKELLADLASGKTPVSKYMEKGFAFLQMLKEKGYIDPTYALKTTPDDAIKDFKKGKGVCISASVNYDMGDTPFAYEMTGANVLDAGGSYIVTSARKIAINPYSKHLDYAKETLEYILKKENLETLAKELKAISPSASENDDYAYMGKERQKAISEIYKIKTIPMEDDQLPFSEWETIRNLGREIMQGKTAKQVVQAYDEIQETAINNK